MTTSNAAWLIVSVVFLIVACAIVYAMWRAPLDPNEPTDTDPHGPNPG